MTARLSPWLTLLAAVALPGSLPAANYLNPPPGSKIVLIGNTLAEREQYFGYWETLWHARFPEHKLIIRNLGWSADEPYLRPRSQDFKDHGHNLTDHKPDFVIAFFGFNESFAGQAGLDKYIASLDKLITETTTTKYNGSAAPKMALVSPIANEDVPGVPASRNNANLKLYTDAMRDLAAKRGVLFVDLFDASQKLMAAKPGVLTFNGVHLNEAGYQALAPAVDQGLFGPAKPTTVDLAKLRAEVNEKNLQFFYDYRAVNGFYIYGGRKKPFGVVNFPEEFVKLRKMIAKRDERIWAVAQGKAVPAKIDDSDTGTLSKIPTNFKGQILITPPEEAQKKFQLAEGFAINLFASEKMFPELQNPVAFAWDAKGRLWVCTMPSYPQYLPGEPVNDKVIVLEDTNGDGVADKCTVFAEGLHVPTGIEIGDGGVYVAQQPNVLFLKDTNGDGKADFKQIILHGFDSADSHHAIHAFEWGPGGELYFGEGTFHHSQIETPYGAKRVKNAGFFRYEPRTHKLDVFISYGFANPWGLTHDDWGQTFVADASGGANYYGTAFSGHVPYERKHPGMKQFLVKQWRPTCGCEFVSSRNFPDDWQGDYLLNNCIGFLGTLRYKMREEGSGFAADPVPPLVRSDDPNFRPVDLQFGPDGALYICDWFNPLIGHMQHSLRDPNRDKTHGRIWRIHYTKKPLVKQPTIDQAPIPALLENLKEYEYRTRYQTRLELRNRPTEDVKKAVADWLAKLDPKDKGYEHHKLEALWTLQHHDVVDLGLLESLLKSPDYRARAAATRVLCYQRDRVPAIAWLKPLVNDKHSRVRLEAVRALSFFQGTDAQLLALESLQYPQDYYLEYVYKETMETLGKPGDLLASGTLPPEKLGSLARVLCQTGSVNDITKLYETALNSQPLSLSARAAVLEGLADAALTRQIKPKGKLETLLPLMQEPALRRSAVRLAGAWQLAAARGGLQKYATEATTPSGLRTDAINALVRLGGPETIATLEALTAANQPLELRYLAGGALARLNPKASAAKAAELLAAGDGLTDPAPLIAPFLDAKGGSDALAAALKAKKPNSDVARLSLRYLGLAGRNDAALQEILGSAAGIDLNPKPPTPEEVKTLLDMVAKSGNAARGEKVFRRAELNCNKCHMINGAGGEVGPDLRDIGTNSPAEYLLRSILIPNEAVKEAYETQEVATEDGRVITGIVVEDTTNKLVLKEATGQLRTIAKKEIAERAKGKTLMPAGLANYMTKQELADLVKFLSELGKPGEYAIRLEPTIRRWRALTEAGIDSISALPKDAAKWQGFYAQTDGTLPLGEIAAKTKVLWLQAEIDVRAAEPFGLAFDSTEGVQAFLDGEPLKLGPQATIRVKPGRVKLTLRVDLNQRKGESLKVDLSLPKGSTHAAPVGGS